jgi:hypothetical protein
LGPRNWTIWRTEKFIAHAGIRNLDFPAHGLVTIPTSLPWLPYYEGRYKVIPLIFSQKLCHDFNEIDTYRGYILYKAEIIFPQNLLHYQHNFLKSA